VFFFFFFFFFFFYFLSFVLVMGKKNDQYPQAQSTPPRGGNFCTEPHNLWHRRVDRVPRKVDFPLVLAKVLVATVARSCRIRAPAANLDTATKVNVFGQHVRI
jgi:hypothetical protein